MSAPFKWRDWPEIWVNDKHRVRLLNLISIWPLGDGLAPLWSVVVEYAVEFSKFAYLDTSMDASDRVIRWNTSNASGTLFFYSEPQDIDLAGVVFNPNIATRIDKSDGLLWDARKESFPAFTWHLGFVWNTLHHSKSGSLLEPFDKIIHDLMANAETMHDASSGKINLMIKSRIRGQLPSRGWIFQTHALLQIVNELKLARDCFSKILS